MDGTGHSGDALKFIFQSRRMNRNGSRYVAGRIANIAWKINECLSISLIDNTQSSKFPLYIC